MTELTQDRKIDRLAKWAGLQIGRIPSCKHHLYRRKLGDKWFPWNPFASHDDAHLLLDECVRRGLLSKAGVELAKRVQPPSWPLFMATPIQKTEAVWAVAFPEGKKQ